MNVRLLFRCNHKGETSWSPGQKVGVVKLSPIVPREGEPGYAETKAFYQATPSGSIEFSTINERALAEFEVGADYYITIEHRTAEAQS